MMDPGSCPHRRTGHRGSNKTVRKTYCTDCDTYVETVTQELAKDVATKRVEVSEDEQALTDKIVNHSVINKNQIIRAAGLMLDEARRLDDGDYQMTSVGMMFIDCADRAIA